MGPASARYRLLLAACGALMLAACEPTQTARPPPAASGGVEQATDANAEQARKAAEARRLRCRQQPEVCVQSPSTGGADKDDAAH